MSTPDFVLCSRVTSRPAAVPGSTAVRCSRCEVAVWLSPSSRSIDAPRLCLDCLARLMRERGEVVDALPPTADQRAEIEAHAARRRRAASLDHGGAAPAPSPTDTRHPREP